MKTTQSFHPVTQSNIMKTILLPACIIAFVLSASAQNITKPNIKGPSGFDVNSYTGNLFFQKDVVSIPDRGLALDLTLTYNSSDIRENKGFGKGWSCEYLAYYTIGKKLTPLQTLVKVLNLACYPVSTPSNADSVTIHWGDGRKDIYRFSGGHYVAPVGIFDQLVQYQTDKYKIISKYGKEYYFDDPGHKSLTKIRDLNGNELNLSYTNSFLSSVMHSSGKSLSFSWNDSCITQVNNSNITPPGNYTFTYQDKKLTGITYPNNGHVSYGYDNSDCLTSFTDENGNITTISYKSSTSVSPVNFVCSPGYWIMMVIPIDRTPQTWTAFYTHTTRAVNRIKTTGTDMSITYDTANNNTIVVRHVVSGNQFTKYSFDAQGRVMKITDNMGYTETLQYDSDNNITKHTDPLGYTTRYVYDDKGNKVQETDANNQSITYSYNTLNRLVSMTDKNNQTTTYSYDSYGNLTHMNLPSNIHETFGYTVGQLSNFLDGKSQNTTYSYVNGYLSSIGHLFGNEYFTTNNIGNVLEKTDPNQHTSYFSYDNMNRLIRRINAAGDSLRYAYDLNGNLTAIRNENGHVTSFTYDPLNRVTAVYSPTGLKSREYDAMGNITKRTNELGHSWKYAYNYQNYPKWEITPENDTTRFSYDAAGNLLGLTDPLGHTTSYQYNHLHLPVTETDAAGLTETYGYDANGNQTMLTDRKGNTTQYTYDALNRLTSVNEPACEANYTYDQNGNLTAIHDGNSHETVYAYNNQDLIASETDALGFTNQYQYDANGNLVIKTDANGNTTTYQYDVLNRLVHKSSGSFFEDYQYDKVGNMTLAANNHISMEFTYDSANRMVSKHILTPGWDKTIHYTYCSCGKRYTMTDPDSGVTTYTYYDDGKIKSLINPENDTISFFYDKAGRLTRQNNANGTHSLYTYDSRNNLLSIYHKTSADSVLQFFEYVYDSNGNRSSMTDNSGINHYYYDGSNQLVKVEYSNGNKEEFVYDRAGNRTQRIMNETKITDYSYDAANRILSSGGTTYTFDKNGSMTQKTDSSGTTHYDYDFNNRLIMIILPSNDTLKYAYDPLGNRISVTDTAGTITRYFYDGVNAIMELDPSGNTMARYTALFEPDSWLEMKRGGANYTYMKDALGSVTGIADLHQNIIKTYNYSSFGELSGQGVSLENPYTFSGREKMNNDCYYFRARFYCPELGRFSSKDLIFGSFKFPNSLVKYLFLRNNPLNFKDPLGLSTDLVGCAKDILDIGNQLFDILPKEFYKEPSGQLSFLKFTEKGIKYPFQEWWGKSTSGKSLFSHLGKVNQGVTALDFAFTNWQVFNGRNLSNLSFMENMDLLHDFGKANLPTLTGILGGAIGTTLGGPLGGLLGGYLGGKLGEWLGNSLDNPPAFQKSNLPDLCSELPNGFNDTKPPLINQGNGNQNGSPGDGTELPAWWLDFPNWLDSLLAGIPLVVPSDPNEIIGPQGYAIPQWVSVKDNLPYTVLFENNPEASGAAQKVVIEVPLGNKVNPYSFRLGDFGFGSFLFQVPSNTTTYSQRLDVATGCICRCYCGIGYYQ
ncbi:MAG: DUF6531 domain-containing protein [Bacteroidetes bacterium]|nr:DUF6531 domain-containing protein [Bacteroidota bacterium]